MTSASALDVKPEISPERQEYYGRLSKKHAAPLWEVLADIVTTTWTYHDHGNTSASPVIWLDILDIPLVNQLCTSFAEHHELDTQPLARPESDSPIFSYPYARSCETLQQLHQTGPVHDCHG